jgi:hypothetical protein
METRALKREGRGRRGSASVIDDNQLMAVIGADPCKTTQEVAEELNTDHSTV